MATPNKKARVWTDPALQACNAELTDEMCKASNAPGIPLPWPLVWAPWKAMCLIRDFGHVDMIRPSFKEKPASVYATKMYGAFTDRFMYSHDKLFGNVAMLIERWYSRDNGRLEREVALLFAFLEPSALDAYNHMSNYGAVLVARELKLLSFQYLSQPIELTSRYDFDLRAAWGAWSKLPLKLREAADDDKTRAGLAAELRARGVVVADEMVDTIARTFGSYGWDVEKQLAIPDYYDMR